MTAPGADGPGRRRWRRCPPAPWPASTSPPARSLVAADVAATAGPRALIPDGWSAVAVAEAVPSGAVVGDPVVAVAGGVVLAAEGVVVGHAGEAVLVAVPTDDGAAVAHGRDDRRAQRCCCAP